MRRVIVATSELSCHPAFHRQPSSMAKRHPTSFQNSSTFWSNALGRLRIAPPLSRRNYSTLHHVRIGCVSALNVGACNGVAVFVFNSWKWPDLAVFSTQRSIHAVRPAPLISRVCYDCVFRDSVRMRCLTMTSRFARVASGHSFPPTPSLHFYTCHHLAFTPNVSFCLQFPLCASFPLTAALCR